MSDGADQQRLFAFRMGERAPETLVIAKANRAAAERLADWRAWPHHALALVGPSGSGKTHLGQAWAAAADAAFLAAPQSSDEAAAAIRVANYRAVLDDAGAQIDELALFRLLELTKAHQGALLIIAQTAPGLWATSLPDLKSRLSALSLARLDEPDRAHLGFVLRRLCRERFINLGQDAERFLMENVPASFAAARAVAEALDAGIVKGAKPVSLAQARLALKRAARDQQEANER